MYRYRSSLPALLLAAGLPLVAPAGLAAGDEVLLTDHEYGAVLRIWQRAAARGRHSAGRVLGLGAGPGIRYQAPQRSTWANWPSSRWRSMTRTATCCGCSSRGRISLNWRLVQMPDRVADLIAAAKHNAICSLVMGNLQ